MIKSNEISVVIQGPITACTSLCIESVKNILPDAELILSTWKNSDLSNIDLSNIILVENDDPNPSGVTYYNEVDKKHPFNLNRQIVSSKNGIDKATNKYVLRMRGDIKIESSDFLKYWEQFDKRNEDFSFFKHRILVPSLVSICPKNNSEYFQVQISDWLQFGLKEDLVELYNLDLMSEEDMDFYVNNDFEIPKGFIDLDINSKWRWGSEQYLFVANFKKKLVDINYPHRKAITSDILAFEKQFFINNFIVLDSIDFKFDNFKHPVENLFLIWCKHFEYWNALYRYNIFQMNYKQNCDQKYKIKFNDLSLILIKHLRQGKQAGEHGLERIPRPERIKKIFKVILEMIKIKG